MPSRAPIAQRHPGFSVFALRAAMLAFAAFALAPAARAQSYFPLTPGATWSYLSARNGAETRTVTGSITILGRTFAVVSYTNSAANNGLDNYWSSDAEGHVFLGGYFRNVENFGLVYDPPLLYLDAPLAVGGTWSGDANVFGNPGMVPQGSIHLDRSVLEAPTLALPAGTFDTFGIGTEPLFASVLWPAAAGFEANGQARPAVAQTSEWFAPGVGLVQYGPFDVFQLTSYGIPTPAAVTSWGRIKSAYR